MLVLRLHTYSPYTRTSVSIWDVDLVVFDESLNKNVQNHLMNIKCLPCVTTFLGAGDN